jgi:3',5'-cyclic-AMP phosphodiesterase
MNTNISRREFLYRSTIAAAAGSLLPGGLEAAETAASGIVRLGLISDVHLDVMHDGPERLRQFVDAATRWKADAIIELGDFCTPKPATRATADVFESFAGRKFHVIGNHDTDGGFKRDQVVEYHRMPGRYYSFDLRGIHGVVLDANDVPPGHTSGYPSHIDDPQIEWLREDLAKTRLPVFVFSHQSLERPTCIRSQEKVRTVLEQARRADGSRKVAACLNGHWHIDHWRLINEIPYIHINSASYYWMGSEFRRQRYTPEIEKAYPVLPRTAPYRDPLFTLLEIDGARGKFTLSPAQTDWVGPSPQECGLKHEHVDPAWIMPRCSARSGEFAALS